MHQHRHSVLMRVAALLFGALLLHSAAHSQQRMRYTQYLLNPFLTNPAVTGVEPYADIRAGFAQQWVGFQGAPRSVYLTAQKGLFTRNVASEDIILNSLPAHGRGKVGPTSTILPGETQIGAGEGPDFHMGVGLQLFSESTGPIAYNGLAGSFAAHIKLVGKLRMGLGASMEMLNYRLNPASIEMLNDNDIALATNRVSLLLPSLNAGVVFYTPRFFLAAASRQVLQNRLEINPANPVISGLEIHYFAQAGMRVKLAENLMLTPSLAIRTVSAAPPSIDLSLQGAYKDVLFLGMTYRHQDALAWMAGFRFNQTFRLDYAYDHTTTQLGKFNSGSHSIVLSICPGYGKTGGRRYFW